MGRELRRVPPNWEHPKDEQNRFVPLYDEDFEPKFTEEPTWYQVCETMSEGTPVTPPFATKEELIEYLATHGDFWDQRRRAEPTNRWLHAMPCGPWGRKAAEQFVNAGWAPSMVVRVGPEGTEIKFPRDGAAWPLGKERENENQGNG